MSIVKIKLVAWYDKYIKGVAPDKFFPPFLGNQIVIIGASASLATSQSPHWMTGLILVALTLGNVWACLSIPKASAALLNNIKQEMATATATVNNAAGILGGPEFQKQVVAAEGVVLPVANSILDTAAKASAAVESASASTTPFPGAQPAPEVPEIVKQIASEAPGIIAAGPVVVAPVPAPSAAPVADSAPEPAPVAQAGTGADAGAVPPPLIADFSLSPIKPTH